MKKSDPPLVVAQAFHAPAVDVWSALTELEQMVQWYFREIPAFEPTVGFETSFNVSTGERDFRHQWRVTEVIPMKKIVYDWSYDAYPGSATVAFELTEQGDSTLLRLTLVVHEDFPQDIPEFTRESCLGGWQYFMQGQLKSYLESD